MRHPRWGGGCGGEDDEGAEAVSDKGYLRDLQRVEDGEDVGGAAIGGVIAVCGRIGGAVAAEVDRQNALVLAEIGAQKCDRLVPHSEVVCHTVY